MRHSVVGVLAFIIVLVFFASAANVAFQNTADDEDSREEIAIENETLIVDYQNERSVDTEAVTYNETVTVRNSSGAELVAGDDYEWHPDRGNVTWFNTTNTTNGEEAEIDYTAHRPAASTQHIEALLTPLISVLPYIFLAVGGFTALKLTSDGWGWS